MVQPAASAGAALRVIMASGKFHGVMAATTPTGSRVTRIFELGKGLGIVALGLFGKPFEKARRVANLTARFGERLALFAA
jgi:hypothetical protein